MDNVTNPISASTGGNLISQQAINSNRLRDQKNSQTKPSDSTSDVIGDTLETSDREADGRQPYSIETGTAESTVVSNNKKAVGLERPDNLGPGNSLDLLG